MKIDWWRIVNDLQAAGLTKAAISKKIGRSQGWVMEIKNSGREPRYSDGAALIELLESCKRTKQ